MENDLESLSAGDLTTRAELPETALAAHYGTVESCVVATYDELSMELYRCQVEAFAGVGDWHTRFSIGVASALEHIEATPGAARLCFTEPTHRHAGLRMRRTAARQRVVRLLADEYEREHAFRLPDLYFEFLVGALFQAAQEEVSAGREPSRVAERVRGLMELLEPVPAY